MWLRWPVVGAFTSQFLKSFSVTAFFEGDELHGFMWPAVFGAMNAGVGVVGTRDRLGVENPVPTGAAGNLKRWRIVLGNRRLCLLQFSLRWRFRNGFPNKPAEFAEHVAAPPEDGTDLCRL